MELPAILAMPEKLRPIIHEFNNYRYFLLEGGRGGGKTQAIARFLSYVGEKRDVRIVCGREIQNTIEESVYTVFKDLITDYQLNYDVFKDRITHRTTGTTLKFKGFREQGSVNIKGLEGVDILWIDEAQAIKKNTLDIIIPTIRKEKAKVFFSMNRYLKTDPVYQAFKNRDDCLIIKINYDENEYCPQALIKEAMECKEASIEDYNHIWLGDPLGDADNYLFNQDKLEATMTVTFPHDANLYHGALLGGDIARYGTNYSSGVLLTQCGPEHWEEGHLERWKKQDLMYTTGQFMDLSFRFNPNKMVIDADGLGSGVVDRMREQKKTVIEFHGGWPYEKNEKERKKSPYKDWRSYGYLTLNDMINRGKLRIKSKIIIDQLKEIKYKFDSMGRKYIIPKEQLIDDARRKGIKYDSPDDADALMMAATRIEELKAEQAKQYTSKTSRIRGGHQTYAQESNILA